MATNKILTASDVGMSIEHGAHQGGTTSGHTSDKYDRPIQILVLDKQLGTVTTVLEVDQIAQVPDDEQNAERPEKSASQVAASQLSSQHW